MIRARMLARCLEIVEGCGALWSGRRTDDAGETVAFGPGREPEHFVRHMLGLFRSSPVFAGKRLYVRTHKHLYCIGE